jgi:hypothetical protein
MEVVADTPRILHLFLLVIINHRVSNIIHIIMQLIPVLPLILVGFGRLLLTRSVWNQKNKEKMVLVGIIVVVHKINNETQVTIPGMNFGPLWQNFFPPVVKRLECVPPAAYSSINNNNNGNLSNHHHRCFHPHHLLTTTTITTPIVVIIILIVGYLLY